MGIFSSMFARKPQAADLSAANRAIEEGRSGRLTVDQMLAELVKASILVPLADAPNFDGNRLLGWKPATVSKGDRSQFLVAFTDQALLTAFAKKNPAHSYAFLVNTASVLRAMPPAHGLVFNIGGTNGFEWSALGIADYIQRVGGAA